MSEGIDAGDKLSEARKRIQTGPAPEWATERTYHPEFKGRPGDHTTYLLFDRQIHAELRQDFFHGAIRLETMEAVQQQSQWQFAFEPGTQSVTFHFIKIRRGETVFEHLNLDKGRLLQREEGLHRFVIDGWYTFLLVLEDVRPGDVLEWAFTITNEPRLLPEFSFHYCGLPEGIPLGTYRFSVRFNPVRPMKWRTSMDGLKPNETMDNDLMRWTWIGNEIASTKPEINTPSWHRSAPWFQISDCPDWGTVARAVSNVWSEQASVTQLEELIRQVEVNSADAAVPARIVKAIQLVQDDFRYLSVNLEFGGQIPAAPGTVARRRYGDCKDLSFLLVNLLKHFGVTARPVLVNSRARKTIGDLLPSPNIFDHAIVEFEADGKRRWIDPTLKYQGGDAFNRAIHEYGFGLPVAPDVTGLVETPKRTGQTDLYELHETLLLDTTGADCRVAAVTRAIGTYAETLRRQFAVTKMEDISKDRLQVYANRYGFAKRVEPLKFRDDRDINQFTIVEILDINRCFHMHPRPGTVAFPIPTWWLRSTLPMPEKGERRTPFALPFPCQMVHIVDVEFPGFQPPLAPRYASRGKYLNFNRTHRVGHQFWVMTFTLDVTADSVPPDDIKKYRDTAEEIWNASAINLLVPAGQTRVRQKKGFGELPALPRPRLAPIQPAAARLAVNAAAAAAPAATPAVTKPPAEQPELSLEMQAITAKAAAKHDPTPAPAQKKGPPAQPKGKGGFWQRLFGGS
jgi:hypothetical protein